MKAARSLGKFAVLVCSIVLAGGYVMLRGGSDILPSSKSDRIRLSSQAPNQPTTANSSGVLSLTPTTQQGQALMAGSKSFVLTPPEKLLRNSAISNTTSPTASQTSLDQVQIVGSEVIVTQPEPREVRIGGWLVRPNYVVPLTLGAQSSKPTDPLAIVGPLPREVLIPTGKSGPMFTSKDIALRAAQPTTQPATQPSGQFLIHP